MDKAIPIEWIKKYTELMIEYAGKFEEPMRGATLLRVDHVMDLVKAWKESQNPSHHQ